MPTQKSHASSNAVDAEFDRKVQEVIREKGRITTSSTEWFRITVRNPEAKKSINVFEGYIVETDTLSALISFKNSPHESYPSIFF